MTNLETTIRRRVCEGSAAYFIEVCAALPRRTWITPNNKGRIPYYDICSQLADLGIIAKLYVPIFRDGCYKGNTVRFLIDDSLEYSDLISLIPDAQEIEG